MLRAEVSGRGMSLGWLCAFFHGDETDCVASAPMQQAGG